MAWARDELEAAGFVGFIPFGEIATSGVRPIAGVYVLLRPDLSRPTFLSRNPGGTRKGDPTVPLDVLTEAWIDDSPIVYIGKATRLRKRLRQFWRYGQGGNSHRGGRYIWQLANSAGLLVAWREHPDGIPRVIEAELIRQFKEIHGRRPFANLAD